MGPIRISLAVACMSRPAARGGQLHVQIQYRGVRRGDPTVQAAPVLANCKLTGNQALLFGGALYNEDGAVVLTNNLMAGNSAGLAAVLGSSALYNVGGSITLNDCTVADNAAPQGMAIASLVWGPSAMGQIMATNSILYNGADEIFTTDPCAVVVAYSDVQGGWSGIGNLDADPHFVNPGRWRLAVTGSTETTA